MVRMPQHFSRDFPVHLRCGMTPLSIASVSTRAEAAAAKGIQALDVANEPRIGRFFDNVASHYVLRVISSIPAVAYGSPVSAPKLHQAWTPHGPRQWSGQSYPPVICGPPDHAEVRPSPRS